MLEARIVACTQSSICVCCLTFSIDHTTAYKGRGISLLVKLGLLVFGSVFNPTYASLRAGLPLVTDQVFNP
jgi:hypothetical protein